MLFYIIALWIFASLTGILDLLENASYLMYGRQSLFPCTALLGFSFFQVKTLMLKPRQRAVYGGKRKSQTQNEHVVAQRRCFFPKSIVFDGHLTQNDESQLTEFSYSYICSYI